MPKLHQPKMYRYNRKKVDATNYNKSILNQESKTVFANLSFNTISQQLLILSLKFYALEKDVKTLATIQLESVVFCKSAKVPTLV